MNWIDMLTGNRGWKRQRARAGGELQELQFHDLGPDTREYDRSQRANQDAAPDQKSKGGNRKSGHGRHGCC